MHSSANCARHSDLLWLTTLPTLGLSPGYGSDAEDIKARSHDVMMEVA